MKGNINAKIIFVTNGDIIYYTLNSHKRLSKIFEKCKAIYLWYCLPSKRAHIWGTVWFCSLLNDPVGFFSMTHLVSCEEESSLESYFIINPNTSFCQEPPPLTTRAGGLVSYELLWHIEILRLLEYWGLVRLSMLCWLVSLARMVVLDELLV